jgi:hypothetical protein
MTHQQIDIMCLVVEEYIFRVAGETVRINRRAVMSDARQMMMLVNAYQIANGNKEHNNFSEKP